MIVERVKYMIWAADSARAANFYQQVFGGKIVRQNAHVTELDIQGALLGIHGGGEGQRTWTGLSFQPENGEPPHLAMCVDPEGNEIMLTRQR